MPSKKRKYNARFPAGRIKKIMQTDEEVGKVAQAVPIIISRTLELFVESLLGKALQVTTTRNAKTLSPSHVKQCILGEARFDFLRDLVKNIPDVSAAEEKEFLTGDSSPNSTSRLTDPTTAPRRIAREDSNSSSSGDVIRVPQIPGLISIQTRDKLKRVLSGEMEALSKSIKIDPPTPGTSVQIDPSTLLNIPPIIAPPNILTPATHPILTPIDPGTSETAIDLSKKEPRPVRTANFYQETFTESPPHSSVIKINPIYTTPQPSTSYTSLNPVEPLRKIEISKPSYERHNSLPPTFERRCSLPRTPVTPITPVINIDFSKNLTRPEIKVLDATSTAASIVSVPIKEPKPKHLSRQNSKSKMEVKKDVKSAPTPVDIDRLNSGNLQIDEDYDT